MDASKWFVLPSEQVFQVAIKFLKIFSREKGNLVNYQNLDTLPFVSSFPTYVFFSLPLRNAASCMVLPPNMPAADPVVAVKRNVLSSQAAPTALQNS